VFVLTHEPPELPDPEVTFLAGDIGEAVATALDAAGERNLEILGADVAGQCLQRGLVDEILVYVLPVLLGDGIRFSSPGLARIDLEPVSSTRRAPSPSSGSASASSPDLRRLSLPLPGLATAGQRSGGQHQGLTCAGAVACALVAP